MKSFWKFGCPVILAGAVISAVFGQRAFRQYPSVEYGESIPLPYGLEPARRMDLCAADVSSRDRWTATRDGSTGRGRKGFRCGPRTIPARTGRLRMRSGA